MNNPVSNLSETTDPNDFDFPMFNRFARDLRTLTVELDSRSAREVVSAYYNLQENRMAFAAQARELEKQESPSELVKFLSYNLRLMEKSLKAPLQTYAESTTVGSWAIGQFGIGPVLAADFYHISILQKLLLQVAFGDMLGLIPPLCGRKDRSVLITQN